MTLYCWRLSDKIKLDNLCTIYCIALLVVWWEHHLLGFTRLFTTLLFLWPVFMAALLWHSKVNHENSSKNRTGLTSFYCSECICVVFTPHTNPTLVFPILVYDQTSCDIWLGLVLPQIFITSLSYSSPINYMSSFVKTSFKLYTAKQSKKQVVSLELPVMLVGSETKFTKKKFNICWTTFLGQHCTRMAEQPSSASTVMSILVWLPRSSAAPSSYQNILKALVLVLIALEPISATEYGQEWAQKKHLQ